MKVWTLRTRAVGVAFSVPLGPAGIVVLGHFPQEQLDAIRAHEEAHLRMHHGWRLAWAKLCRVPISGRRLMRWRFEHEADEEAARLGHADGLLSYLWSQWARPTEPSHPPITQRIDRVTRLITRDFTVHR